MVVNINYEDGWYSLVYICDLQVDWSLRTIVFYREKNPNYSFSPSWPATDHSSFFCYKEARAKWLLQSTKGEKTPSILGSGAGGDPVVLFLSGQHCWTGDVKGGICSFFLETHILVSWQRKTGSESWYLMWREIPYSMKSVHFTCLHLAYFT